MLPFGALTVDEAIVSSACLNTCGGKPWQVCQGAIVHGIGDGPARVGVGRPPVAPEMMFVQSRISKVISFQEPPASVESFEAAVELGQRHLVPPNLGGEHRNVIYMDSAIRRKEI